MEEPRQERKARFGRVLGAVFLVALVMGPGPGAQLVDGTPEAPNFVAGVPALWAWLVFWFLVMTGCVLVAAQCLWKDED